VSREAFQDYKTGAAFQREICQGIIDLYHFSN